MKIENFNNVTIIYMRTVGEYGFKNQELMETFKHFLKGKNLLDDESVILGIALDNPKLIPTNKLRYDVGLIVDEYNSDILNRRKIADGKYAIFEVLHARKDIQNFWRDIPKLTEKLFIDYEKPIIERYSMAKIKNHLCEFCIPLK